MAVFILEEPQRVAKDKLREAKVDQDLGLGLWEVLCDVDFNVRRLTPPMVLHKLDELLDFADLLIGVALLTALMVLVGRQNLKH